MTVDYEYIDAVGLLMIYNLDFVDFLYEYMFYKFLEISRVNAIVSTFEKTTHSSVKTAALICDWSHAML